MPTKFTLVIPAYNESAIIEETLREIIRVFKEHCPEPWSIILADNASTDGTSDIALAINDPHVSVVHIQEKGRGRAIRAAFAAAGEGIVAFTDADLPIDLLDVLKGVHMVRSGECEIVVGKRIMVTGVSKRSWLRRLVSKTFQILAFLIVGIDASDSQCPLRIMNERTRPIMLATVNPTWWCELEFLVLAEKLGVSIKELPVVWNEERYPRRKSTVMLARDTWEAICAMFQMRSYLKPKIVLLKKELQVS